MYRNLNDYEILYMVSEGKDDNFNILYEKYRPLIYKIAKDYINLFKKYGYEIDDLMQIGYITLYKASYLYNVYNNSMFYTYFKNAFKNAITTEIRCNTTDKKEVLNNALSYDKEIPNSDNTYMELLEDKEIGYDEDYNNFLITFKNSMPFDMSCIFELYYNGYNVNEISVLLNKSMDFVKDNLKEIKRHGLTYKYLFLN